MADHPSTAPLSRAALLRVSETTGQLQSQQYVITVTSGPDVGKVLVLDGIAVVGTSPDNALVLSDPTVSRQHLEIRVSGNGVRVKDLGSKNGTFMGGARLEQVVVEEKATLTLGQTVLHLALRQESLGDTRSNRASFGSAIGQSPAMRQLFGLLERIAPRDVSVLLTGETGTGKEVLARAIHNESPRRNQPFVVVDCGSIPTELIQSELFGHVKGSFTSAVSDREGAFLQANGGTIFLDEVGELPLAMQPHLLRVLEEQTLQRVGENKRRRVDVRLVAATHRDLEAEVEAGRFRSDLFFRLAVVTAKVPPLRERRDDLPLLVAHFIKEQAAGPFEVSDNLMEKLRAWSWPGNVRELRNVISRAVAGLEVDGEISGVSQGGGYNAQADALAGIPFSEAKDQLVDSFTREYIAALLEQCEGNISAVARKSGLNRNYVRQLVVRHNLKHEK